MGCLPPILLLLAGYGIGYAWAEQQGAVIGAGVGLAIGLLLAIPILWAMRRANRKR